jgi:hypothetical protein
MRNTFGSKLSLTTLSFTVRLALLAVVTSLAMSSLARADDDDYRRRDAAQQRAYQNGYRDGVDHGRYDLREGYRYNVHSQQYNDACNGYEHWMGSFGHYKHAYRGGYEDGYRRAFDSAVYRRDRDGDRDDYRRHDGWR